MKVKLVVGSGVHEGREIPIAGQQFVIGRDPQCQLRPSSPAISKKHCAIILRGNKVFIRDFGSTNGTWINGLAVTGEMEVTDQAKLKVGPLDFRLLVEATAEQKPLAAAPKKPEKAAAADDDFAAFLLEGDGPAAGTPTVPDGSTVMELGAMNADGTPVEKKKEEKKPDADTRSAAAEILKMYQRRPRS